MQLKERDLRGGTGMATILVCDDAMFMRQSLIQMLKPEGHEVVAEAGDGLECIEQYKLYKPDIVLMDEPSMGLSPLYVNEIFDIIQKIKSEGTTVLLVEQNAKKALSIADRAYVLETGNIVLEGDAKELMNDESVKKAYLGE